MTGLQGYDWLGKDGKNRERRVQGKGLRGSYFSPAGCLLHVRRNAPVLANIVVASHQMAQEFSMSFFSIMSTPVFFPTTTAFITLRSSVTQSCMTQQGSGCPSIKQLKCALLPRHPLFLSRYTCCGWVFR